MKKTSSTLLFCLAAIGFFQAAAFGQDNASGLSAGGNFVPGFSRSSEQEQGQVQKIERYVRGQLSQQNCPAYHLTVIKNGKVILHHGYGTLNLDSNVPVTSQTVFGLASLTKTFTALTLLSLVDKGLIGLDDPLSKYLDDLTPEYKSLTIRQLASMTAGVPKTVPEEIRWPEQIKPLVHLPLVSQPGSQFLYSNFSYRLLGSVIEKVTGKPFLEVVREKILLALNMSSTATTEILQSTGNLAQAYGDNNGKGPLRAIEYKDPHISFSAGMLASCGDDLLSYVRGMWSGKMLSPDGYKTLWSFRPPLSTGEASNWAFGWSSVSSPNYAGKNLISMNGGTPGVASTIIMIPSENCAVISLANLRKPPVYAIAKIVARMAFGDLAQEGAADPNAMQPEFGKLPGMQESED